MNSTWKPILVAGLVAAGSIVSCHAHLESTTQAEASPPEIGATVHGEAETLESPDQASTEPASADTAESPSLRELHRQEAASFVNRLDSLKLTFAKTQFESNDPIVVDVYLTNETNRERSTPWYSLVCSGGCHPCFVFAEITTGAEFSLLPGLYTNDFEAYDRWHKAVTRRGASRIGLTIPAGKTIHLLHGDLREMVTQARDYCAHALRESPLFLREGNTLVRRSIQKANEPTRRHYEEVVKFARRFLRGGEYDIFARAFCAESNEIRIRVAGPDE